MCAAWCTLATSARQIGTMGQRLRFGNKISAIGAGRASLFFNDAAWRQGHCKQQGRALSSYQYESRMGTPVRVGGAVCLAGGLAVSAWYTGCFEPNVSKAEQMLKWLEHRKIMIVVFELDYTMSAASSSDGLPKHELEDYLALVSEDFVAAAKMLAKEGFKMAIATRGDPSKYTMHGVDRDRCILGADLARLVLQRRCPEVLPHFAIMVGYDPELQRRMVAAAKSEGGRGGRGLSAKWGFSSTQAASPPVPPEVELGKRHHMRKIAQHYQVDFKQMVLFDASPEALQNEDGWIGVLVTDRRVGFQFDDCLSA